CARGVGTPFAYW
nr:immunoglobulin heavy chain junction region [Mus musculus]